MKNKNKTFDWRGGALADRIDDCISRFQSLAGRHRYTGSSRSYCDFALRDIKRVTENHSQYNLYTLFFSLKLFRSVCLSIFLNLFHFSSQSNSIPIYVYGCIVYIYTLPLCQGPGRCFLS